MSPPALAVILAGGGGTRLWPLTGAGRLKPLLPWGGGGRTLLAAARDRSCPPIDPSRVRLLCPADLAGPLRAGLEGLAPGHVWCEPSPRDSGPALLLAAHRMVREEGDGLLVALPADHRVEDEPAFRRALDEALGLAAEGHLVTLGVIPGRPSSAYGYLRLGADVSERGRQVSRFLEKPDEATARRLLDEGDALWNAGIFVWRASVFLEAYGRFAPEVAAPAERAAAALVTGRPDGDDLWSEVPPGPVDRQLMEKADDVVTVPLEAGWDDLGDWEAVLRLHEASPGELGVRSTGTGLDAPGCRILDFGGPDAGPVAVAGVPGVVVVRGPGGVLVLRPEAAGRVRELARHLARRPSPLP